jgi:hypothetical protein
MKYIFSLLIFCSLSAVSALNAEVAAAVLPFDGDDPGKTEFRTYIMKEFAASRQISVLADDKIKEIMTVQEKAQATGSALHDISKLKSAEYLITGNITADTVELTVIDVNTGAKIFYRSEAMSAKNRSTIYYSLARGAIEKIVSEAAGKSRDVPEEAADYMQLLNAFVQSLGGGDEASYRYIAVYQKGKFVNPDEKDKKSVDKVKRFLKVVRPNLIRAKLTYLSMEKTANNVAVIIAATKAGSVTKHKFVFVELESGTLALLNESYSLVN